MRRRSSATKNAIQHPFRLTKDTYSISNNPKYNAQLSLLIQNLYLDRALLGIRRNLERLDSPLQREPMSDQRLQIHQSAADEPQRLGVLVAVPVLELQVDLVGGEVHEWVGLFGFADADDEDFAAEADGLEGDIRVSLRRRLRCQGDLRR